MGGSLLLTEDSVSDGRCYQNWRENIDYKVFRDMETKEFIEREYTSHNRPLSSDFESIVDCSEYTITFNTKHD